MNVLYPSAAPAALNLAQGNVYFMQALLLCLIVQAGQCKETDTFATLHVRTDEALPAV